MRFLRLDFRDDLNSIDFHPLLTVVSSLSEVQRRQLFAAVRRISSGSTVGLHGLVEHQGVMVELDASAGEPLGAVTTTAAVVVFVDGVAIRQDQVGLQAEIDQWERQATIDAVAVEEIRSNLDLAVRARAHNLLQTVDPNAVGGAKSTSPRRLKVEAIHRAFAAVGAHEPMVADCDPAMTELIERWEAHLELVKDSEEHLDQVAHEVRMAERAVQDRRTRLDEAKLAAQPKLLTAAQETRLEELNDIVQQQSSRRGKRKRGLTDEEEREKQELLASVGVRSWTEYSMFRLSPTVSAERQEALDEAEAELAMANLALERAKEFQARDEVAARLQTNLDRIKSDAKPYLGVLVPSDIGAALQKQISQVENPDWVRAVNDLRDVLSSNDLHPPYGFEPSDILGWTDSWLRAQDSIDESGRPAPSDGDQNLTELKEQMTSARHSLVKHNRALAQIDRAERAAIRSAMRVRDLKNQLRVRSAEPEAATAADVYDMVKPVADRVLQEVKGSIPIAVVGDMAGLPGGEAELLMTRLESLASQVQVILVSAHPALQTWAERAGKERVIVADGTRTLI